MPSASTTEAAVRPAGPSWTSETTAKRPRRWRGSSTTETVTGPTKTYSSVRACSRAASSSSRTRASRKLSNRSKSDGGQVDDEGIGRDQAVDAQAPLEVHLPGQPAPDLHRMEFAPEGLGEGAVDHALEAPFELLQSHVGVSLPVSTPW